MSTDQAIATNQIDNRKMVLIGVGITALAYVPLLISHFETLWRKEQYQYFPFVLAAFGAFLWQRRNDLVPSGFRLRIPLMASMLLAAWALLAFASIAWSPWAGAVSAVLAVGALFLYLFRDSKPRNLLGIWLLLWLMVPLPLNYDGKLVAFLQRLSSTVSSHVLDLLKINHLMTGNVLQVPDKQFFVDEACSGIVSIMSVIAAGGMYCVWKNRHALHVVALLVGGVLWAVLMNVARITSIAVAHEWWNWDLSTGWSHEALGLVLFSLTFVSIMSTDQVLEFLLAEINLDKIGQNSIKQNPFVFLWNGLVTSFHASRGSTGNVASHIPGWRWWVTWPFLIALPFQFMPTLFSRNDTDLLVSKAMMLEASVLPTEIGPWKQVKFEKVKRDYDAQFGENSRTFTYRHAATGLETQVSLDFPYFGWHDLTVCYEGIGWKVADRGVVSAPTKQKHETWDYASAKFKSGSTSDEATLMYSGIYADGSLADADVVGDPTHWVSRLLNRFSRKTENFLQIQMWMPHSVDEQVIRDIEALFLEAREKMREYLVKAP